MKTENKYHLSIGYFGKLPAYPDFIKNNAGTDEIIKLDNWIQTGITKAKDILKSDWKDVYRNSPRYNFLYPFPNSSKIMLGIMFPGTDKSDREFPFLAYLIMKNNTLKHTPAHILTLVYLKLFGFFNNEFKHSPEGESISAFRNIIENVQMHDPPDEVIEYQNYLSATTVNKYFERTFGSFDTHTKYKVLGYLDKFFSGKFNSELKRSSNTAIPDAIKISLNYEEDFKELDIAFLFDLASSFADNASYLPVSFWTIFDNKSIIYFYLNNPDADNYIELINPQINNQRTLSIEVTGEYSLLDSNNQSTALNKLLYKQDLTLSELLEKIKENKKRSYKFWQKLMK